MGGIDRAGLTSTGRVGATCFVGIGFGIGTWRRAGWAPWVERAGVVARDRLTAVAVESLAGTLVDFLRSERVAV